MIESLSIQQKLACDKIIQGEYFIENLPSDFDTKPIGTFAITQGESLDLFHLFYVDVEANNKLVNKLQIKVKVTGEYEIVDKLTGEDLDKQLNALNADKIILGVPIKMIQILNDVYIQNSTNNLMVRLQLLNIKEVRETEFIKTPFQVEQISLQNKIQKTLIASTLQELKQNKQFYWKKKRAGDISRFLQDNPKEGSYIFYEKQNGTPMIAYLKNKEVMHTELIFPIEPIEGLIEAIPLTEENLQHLIEIKDNRLYSTYEVKRSLKKEFEDAQKFQNEEIDKLNFSEALNQMTAFNEDELPLLYDGKNILNRPVGIACCQGRRESMEDAHLATEITFILQDNSYEGALFGVFDGHGGDACAKYIAANMKQILINHLQEYNKAMLSEANIFNAIKMAFVELSKNYPQEKGGSTATIALIIGSDIFVANVGDSRTLIQKKGEAVTLSVDAKPQAEKFKQGIEQRGGQVVFSRGAYRVGRLIAIARAIGDKNIQGITARPKITKFILDKAKLNEGWHLVLASDGLFEVCSSRQAAKEIFRLFTEGKTCEEIAKGMVEAAFHVGSTDNITVMIVDLGGGQE
jgi:protein phosphatase 1L